MANTKIPIELSSTPSIVDNGDATAITIDSSERVIVGQTAIATGFENFAQLETSHASAGGLVINTQTASTSNYGRLIFTKGNASGNEGLIRYNTGDYHMSFWTAATQRLRLDSDGLKFGSDTAAANALDDYEEGTWTPTDASGASLSFSTIDKNRYTKIGRFVMAHTRIDYPSTSNTSTATVSLPVTPSTDCIASVTGGVVVEQNYDSSVTLTAAVDGTNGARFRINGVGALQNQNLSGKSVRFTVIYISD